MKKIYFLLLAFLLALSGCATKTTTTGREFDAAKVINIKKGITTSHEVSRMFGKPLEKTVLSDKQVVWGYSWKTVTSHTSSGPYGPVVTSSGDKQTLEVLLKNGVVVNYLYKNDPFWIEKLQQAN